MDHFNQQNRTSDLVFNIPLIRLRRENATKTLLHNPGGPGYGALSTIYMGGDELSTMVGGDFHILSFDPRGVNSSLPAARCFPAHANGQLNPSTPGLRDPNLYASTTNFVNACRDTMGEHGKYINSPQTAADMNSILDAIGQQDMIFWGISYGSLLGQTYAALFPNRSSRIVIDSVAHLFEWYESPVLTADFSYTQEVFEGFIDECIKAGERCALSSRAESKEELKDKLAGFLNRLGPEPMSVYINSTRNGIISSDIMWYSIYSDLYSPSAWPEMATALAQLMNGNGTDSLMRWADDDGVCSKIGPATAANYIITINDGLSGSRYWPQGLDSLVDELSPYERFNPWFNGAVTQYYVRQQWKIARTHSFRPRRGVQTAYPMLILQNRYDPICPRIGAQVASETFVNSRLVEVDGYGHGATYALPSTCAVGHLRAYLRNGTLPQNGTLCRPDKPYFLPPDEPGVLSGD
ncbi:hypothetical protein CDD83_8111 [Cordyceps sp. RAO-2017]|nr:hypothetical protein CDD83_8111 [Cordyceps sp. RAO-2017]